MPQTQTKPASPGMSWNRYIRNGPNTEMLLTIPPAEDMNDDIDEELDEDGLTPHPNPTSFATMNTGFHNIQSKFLGKIIWHQLYLEVIQNFVLGLVADYELNVDADDHVAWLCEKDYILNPPTMGSLANLNHKSCVAA